MPTPDVEYGNIDSLRTVGTEMDFSLGVERIGCDPDDPVRHLFRTPIVYCLNTIGTPDGLAI